MKVCSNSGPIYKMICLIPELTRQITVIPVWVPLGAFRPISVNATACLRGIVAFEEEVVSSSGPAIPSEQQRLRT